MGIETISHYVSNARVLDWRAYLGFGIIGFLTAVNKPSLFNLDQEPWILLAKILVTLVFYLSFAFSINNCYDIVEDSFDTDKLVQNTIASEKISFIKGLTFSFVTGAVGIFFCVFWFNTISLFLYITSIILAALYSAPPLRFKARPFFDIASHGLFFGILLFLYGASTLGFFNLNFMVLGAPIFIYSVTLELRNHLEDFEGDKEAKIITIVQKIGVNTTSFLLTNLLIIHWLLMSIIFLILPLFPIFLLSVIMMIVTILVKDDKFLRVNDVVTSICYIVMAVQT
ncbi:UbiA family prenyltransferase [Thermoproteota archaeon]